MLEFETVTLDHQNWIGQSSDDLGYTGDFLRTASIEQYSPDMNVACVDARPNGVGPTIIGSTSLDERLTPFYLHCMAVNAKHRGARLLMSDVRGVRMDVENPVHVGWAHQTSTQTLEAFRGNPEPIGAEQLRALDEVYGFEEGEDIEIEAHSLANFWAYGMIKAIATRSFEKRLTITKLHMIEPVNSYGKLSVQGLMKEMLSLSTVEMDLEKRYIAENKDIGHGNVIPFDNESKQNKRIDRVLKMRQFVSSHVAGAGIRIGLDTLAGDILKDRSVDGAGLHEAEIIISHGAHSTVSRRDDILRLARTIKEAGGNVRLLEYITGKGDNTPIAHSVFRSLGRIAERGIGLANLA
jgi:hypothetical protein